MALPLVRRPDFTNALVHLTHERVGRVRHSHEGPHHFTDTTNIPAFSVLKEILRDGKIVGSGNSGFVKGSRRAVCFSEIPLSTVQYFAGNTEGHRYSFYGVAANKEAIFS